jgi:hypothetical protein
MSHSLRQKGGKSRQRSGSGTCWCMCLLSDGRLGKDLKWTRRKCGLKLHRKKMPITGLKKSYQSQANRSWKTWIMEEGARASLARHPLYDLLMSYAKSKCRCMLQLVMAGDYVEIQHSEKHHQAPADSHAQDDSKRLKYDQWLQICNQGGGCHCTAAFCDYAKYASDDAR